MAAWHCVSGFRIVDSMFAIGLCKCFLHQARHVLAHTFTSMFNWATSASMSKHACVFVLKCGGKFLDWDSLVIMSLTVNFKLTSTPYQTISLMITVTSRSCFITIGFLLPRNNYCSTSNQGMRILCLNLHIYGLTHPIGLWHLLRCWMRHIANERE